MTSKYSTRICEETHDLIIELELTIKDIKYKILLPTDKDTLNQSCVPPQLWKTCWSLIWFYEDYHVSVDILLGKVSKDLE